jgi:hypothetical protein
MRGVSFRTVMLIVGTMLLVPVLTSCIARRPAGIASSTAPVTPIYANLGEVEDTTCNYSILYIIPWLSKDPTNQLIDNLVKQKGADALIGVVVEHRQTVYPFFASDCTVVKGHAVKNSR